MLALSRKVNESIMIGNEIGISVLEIKGDQVKLGIRAPKNVSIYREEIFKQIQEANREAVEGVTPQAESLTELFLEHEKQ